MLTLKNLSLTAADAQGRADIVKNVSLDVEDGKFLVITGPNGGGKTTLARLIARFADATEGSILVGGVDVKTIAPQVLMDTVSFVFQNSFPCSMAAAKAWCWTLA